MKFKPGDLVVIKSIWRCNKLGIYVSYEHDALRGRYSHCVLVAGAYVWFADEELGPA